MCGLLQKSLNICFNGLSVIFKQKTHKPAFNKKNAVHNIQKCQTKVMININ